VAVIYTHSHPDHFGGVLGVITKEQLANNEVEIYAPVGFMEAAVAESILAGTAMARRAQYMYGNLLEVGARGLLSNGLGLTTSTGRVNLIAPTIEITEPIADYDIDGVTFTFMLAPETEAPAELLFYLPAWKALCSAEDACHVLHNLYTLRGAKTRDANAWVHYLQVALDLFGDAEVVFAQHHWPTWGREEVRSFLAAQRDAYKFLHDQTLRLANAGFTMNEIAEQLDWPEDLGAHWANRGYYGSVSHNTKAVYNFYLGFFDANPAHLNPHPPVEQGKRYVALAGGGDALMASAAQAFAAADYRWVAELVSHLVFAEPDRRDARELLAETFEQLAYACENGVWRNFYLSGAKELIEGPPEPVASSTGAAIASALSIDQLFQVLAVRLNGERAAGMRRVINFNFTNDEPFTIELIHSVLHAFRGRVDERATLTITCPSTLLSQALRGEANLLEEIGSGNVTVDGELSHLFDVLLLLDTPSLSFAIVEP
jgi:alkyl sulfatase BDS1-like metallo-beta-lactamase superfamily hydrolase